MVVSLTLRKKYQQSSFIKNNFAISSKLSGGFSVVHISLKYNGEGQKGTAMTVRSTYLEEETADHRF